MNQPIPNIVQLPPNNSGVSVDGVQITVGGKVVYRQNEEVACPVNPQSAVFSATIPPNSVGATFACNAIPAGYTGYLMKVKVSSTAAIVAGGYTLCPSGCNQTIPASPFTILESVHNQGVNAFAYAFDGSGNAIFPPNFSVARNSSGDLTITYTTSPSRIVITGPGNNSGQPIPISWIVKAGANTLGYLVSGDGSDEYSAPHRFFDQCQQADAFSLTPTNPGGVAVTIFATVWFDQIPNIN